MIEASTVVTSRLPVASEQLSELSYSRTGQLRARINASDDDSLVQLFSKRASASTGGINGVPPAGWGVEGGLFGALKEISALAKRLEEMGSNIGDVSLSPDKAKALAEEKLRLEQQYRQIVESDSFNEAIALLKQASDALANGSSVSAFSSDHVRSVLGDRLLAEVAAGSINTISGLSNSLSNLTSIDPSSHGALEQIRTATASALSAFARRLGFGTVEEDQLPDGTLKIVKAPHLRQMSFDTANTTAIALRTLDSKDMIKAAAAHMDFDSQNVLLLITDDREPEHKTKQEEEQSQVEKARKGEEEAKVALFYGSRAPEAVVIDPDTKEITW